MINVLDAQNVGLNIKKHREMAGLTQQELASKLFVSFQAVSAWERGIALPDLENAVKLSKLFGIRLDSLITQPREDLYIAVDGGGTKTEFVLFEKNGTVIKKLILEFSNPNDIGMDKCIDVLTRGIDSVSANALPTAIFAGIAGVSAGNHRAVLEKTLSDKYGIPVFVDTDAINVLCMADDIANSASVICGTGSCVFIRKNYKLTRIGGWGYLFDRAGSAYDIGNDLIRHTLAVYDGLEAPTLLSKKAEAELGDIWKHLPTLYEKGKPYIASLAPWVEECAAMGDKTSVEILENNAKRLASLIKTARTKHGAPDKLICAGGFFKSAPFREMVEGLSDTRLILPNTPPVYGACVECMRLCGIETNEQFKNKFIESYR